MSATPSLASHTCPAVTRAARVPRERAPQALPGLSVVLPCFDEASNVADAVRAATRAASRCSYEHEIIVVDDGSRDETAAITATLIEADPRVRLLIHGDNRGYGEALRSGIEAARMPWVLITDADLQFDLGELETFLPAAERSELVIGWRIKRCDPINRRVNAAAWNWLVRRTFGLAVRDVDCAFKLMRRDLLSTCRFSATGAMISTELLVRCLAAGARMEEIGVHHRPRVAGVQSGASPRVVMRALRELSALRVSLRRLALMTA